jgi:Zn-finger nucleic acid-binding protein
MICPKCEVEMNVFQDSGFETDVCPKCKGVWVDNIEEKEILKILPEVFTVSDLRRLREIYKPVEKVDNLEKVKYYKCPRCGQLMWRKNYMSHSGIVVDNCSEHGTFFDDGEILKAIEFIKAGGVEYEKLRITERGLSDIRSKLITEISRVERADLLGRRARWLMLLGF